MTKDESEWMVNSCGSGDAEPSPTFSAATRRFLGAEQLARDCAGQSNANRSSDVAIA